MEVKPCDECGSTEPRGPNGECVTCRALEDAALAGDYTFDEHAKDVSHLQREEAKKMLRLDASALPTWCSRNIGNYLGPITPGEIVIIGARPGCGKTSLMMWQAKHMAMAGQRVIFAGTEMPGWKLRVMLGAQACKLSVSKAIQNRWEEMPIGARDRVEEAMDAFDKHTTGLLYFTPEDRMTHTRLLEYVRTAGEEKATLFVDHLLEVDWGARGGELTGAMSEGLQLMKDEAKKHNVRLIMAAQLKRPGTYDVLGNYLVPDQSAIKQCGTIEEIAHTILLMHRALKEGLTDGDLRMVRQGQRRLSDVKEKDTSVVTIAKSRLVGHVQGEETRLYVCNSELFDTPEERNKTYGALGSLL